MNIKETKLECVLLIKPEVHGDKRGHFFESFNFRKLNEHIGNFNIVQVNQSKSKHGVLRGLHFQKPPYTQAKLVEVLRGVVLDVVVDIRSDSPTFGEHDSFILSEKEKQQLFVPRGFAHGFVVLSNTAKFQYAIDNYYSPEHEDGIYYNDSTLNIDWEITNPKISDKDKQLLGFNDVLYYKTMEYYKNP